MNDRLLTLAVMFAGGALLGLQVWAKPRPSEEDVRRHTQMFTRSQQWHERLAPAFELTLTDGSTFRLADEVGRNVVILNFFATWCGPCRAEMPELQRYQQAHASESVLLLGIDAEEKPALVDRFIADLGLTFPVGIDESGDLLKQYGVSAFPTTVVIGAAGRIKLYETGAISNADVALGRIVAPEVATIRDGRGITAESYREALAREGQGQPKRPDAAIDARGRRIADAMPCPCGCDDMVSACACRTARAIKARLAQGGYEGKADAEVMQALNREFCMKGM
jgi:peroxiredoxin